MTEQKKTANQWTVLVVDDIPQNIDVLSGILSPHYKVKAAINGRLALTIAEKVLPDLILLDVMMPDMSGLEVCRRLKSNIQTAHIPVIFVTALSETDDEQRGFDVGAVDYITKPVKHSLVLARVRSHLQLSDQHKACHQMVELKTRELQESQRAAIFMLGEASHYNDTDTGDHIWRMASYSAALARAVGWSVADTEMLELAAPMHDMGKIGVPDEILKAPRKLTPEEWEIMKSHTEIGYRILKQSDTLLFKMAADIARSHHEKWNGGGYPQGLSAEAIPECARIVALADVFDALTIQRPYKQPWHPEAAFSQIQQERGASFEPRLIDAFLDIKHEILNLKGKYDLD